VGKRKLVLNLLGRTEANRADKMMEEFIRENPLAAKSEKAKALALSDVIVTRNKFGLLAWPSGVFIGARFLKGPFVTRS
jgi:hypothetical protein